MTGPQMSATGPGSDAGSDPRPEVSYRTGRCLACGDVWQDDGAIVVCPECASLDVSEDPRPEDLCGACGTWHQGQPCDLDDRYADEEPWTEVCPRHGEQTVTGQSSTRGGDPYAIDHLACGCRVVCYGPGEPSVIL